MFRLIPVKGAENEMNAFARFRYSKVPRETEV